MEDLILDIQKAKESTIANEDELEIINNIISHIEMIKRKYGGSIDSVIEYRDSIIQEKVEFGGYNTKINLLTRI